MKVNSILLTIYLWLVWMAYIYVFITAFETVKNIVNGVLDKSNLWEVNTEKE